MRRLALAFAVVLALAAVPAYAQLGLLGTSGSVTISLSPQYPGPHDTVTLTAQSSVLDLSQSSIVWSVNGAVVAQGTGQETANVTVGALGSDTAVTVQATAPDSTSASATAHIIPTELDLLYDSDSYTPPFYRGRSLPSAGSSLVLQALPHFVEPGGTTVPASDLTYTWRDNGQVMGQVSGKGKSAIVIPSPVLYGTDVISVQAQSSDGLLSGQSSVSVSAVDPIVVLYEDHPLYGILYEKALDSASFIPESEMTFAAVPYFATAHTPADATLQYAWRVNGQSIRSDAAKPNELTLQAGDTSNTALIELSLTHATNYFLDAQGSWNITFSSSSGSAGTQDAFHAGTQ